MWPIDPLYYLTIVPGLSLTLWVWNRSRAARRQGRGLSLTSRISGAEAAALVLRAGTVEEPSIRVVRGVLLDFYDTRDRVLRLARGTAESRTLTAVAAAVHEAGHALQQRDGYRGLWVRNALVPAATLGSQVCWLLFTGGLLIGVIQLLALAVGLFTLNVLVQIAGVPIERDASRRARKALLAAGQVTASELELLGEPTYAAETAHVVAALTGVSELFPWPRVNRAG
jgi:Zn-dependent membrane protease YugP